MSSSTKSASHFAVVLCAMVSSGKIRLPLSHSHALECVACFNGHHSWNELASLAGADAAKLRARALREAINARLVEGHLSLQKAEESIAQVFGEWSGTGDAPRSTNQTTLALPITFSRHPFDGAWEAHNPNPLVDDEELDALISRLGTKDTRQKLEGLFVSHPGDIEVCHTLGSRLLEQDKLSSALEVWRHAWSLIQPGLDEVLREDSNAIVSYSSLRNRPILRALHGLATCLGRHQDEASLAEHEKLVRMGYSLMRYRDTFSFKIRLAQCLASRGEWKDVKELMESDDSTAFNGQAITVLALHHLGDKKRLAKAQRSLIDGNAFAAEVLLRGRKVEKYTGESVMLGTWQEGAEHMVLFTELWRFNDSWKIWRRYRQRIKAAQTTWLKHYWNTRSVVGRSPDYLGALVEKLGGLHGRSMPLVRKERRLVESLIPIGCLPQSFAIAVSEIQSFTFQTFEDWLKRGYPLNGNQRGLVLEWLVWRMIQEGGRQIVVKPRSVYLDGKLMASVSSELQDNLWDIIAWELDGQLLDRPLLVRAPAGTQIFECRFSGQWVHEDAGITLSLAA